MSRGSGLLTYINLTMQGSEHVSVGIAHLTIEIWVSLKALL